ncbi:MAG TPA: M23 family metallopeptidase [Caulobacteraceae bacterium]|nr:M23 family metallopeptidase [Caulobacteraceae bacterium]
MSEFLGRTARAVRLAASAVALLGAAAIVGGVVDQKAEASVTETVEMISFANPVPGHKINSPFGFRRLPWEKKERLHAGIDIAAPKGSPVVATTDGIVLTVGTSPTYGNFVEVAHGNGLTSKYAHLTGAVAGVEPGLSVDTGQEIALVGSTGRSTGPHLHFELRKDGEPMDPARFTGRTFRVDQLASVEASAFARALSRAKYTILGKS